MSEQFLHWEMDAFVLQDLTPSSPLPPSSNVALVLGAPPYVSRHSSVTAAVTTTSTGTNSNDGGASSSSAVANVYRPPPGVLFQLLHEPSGVPFHRLPPGYLTNLNSMPHGVDRQAFQVPGRQADLPYFAQPAITFEEGHEMVVVDDIQFARRIVPTSYVHPQPNATSIVPNPEKTYQWCCRWLSGEEDLILPFCPREYR